MGIDKSKILIIGMTGQGQTVLLQSAISHKERGVVIIDKEEPIMQKIRSESLIRESLTECIHRNSYFDGLSERNKRRKKNKKPRRKIKKL